MAKKFKYTPVIGNFVALNQSFNKLKTKGSLLLNNFRSFLEDDDLRQLLSVNEHHFESFIIEIFDLRFFIRIEIDLIAEDNKFNIGKLATYYMTTGGELTKTDLLYKYDVESKLYKNTNESIRPDFIDMEDFTIEYVKLLMEHIWNKKYTTIPNSTYEGNRERSWKI